MFDEAKADHAVNFINCLKHTKGRWRGVPFELLPWQDEIIRTLYGTVKENGYRQYNTCYCEIPKKNGKSELAAAIALYMTCGDGEWGAEVYGCASDRQQASIVFDVAVDMVDQCPALKKRIKPVMSVKRLVYKPTNSFYQVLSAEAYSKTAGYEMTTLTQEDGDPDGPFTLAAYARNENTEAEVIWIDCGNMDNEGIYQVLPGNVTFLQACATTLAFEESTTLIESKALEAAPLEVSNSTSVALGLTFVIILPAAVLAAGAVVVLLRRRK